MLGIVVQVWGRYLVFGTWTLAVIEPPDLISPIEALQTSRTLRRVARQASSQANCSRL